MSCWRRRWSPWTQAARYERSEARQGYRSGHYDRNLTTTSGNVTLHMPRLKGVSSETAIIERYRRRESSVEEALIEMYLAGVSVRRVEDIDGGAVGQQGFACHHQRCGTRKPTFTSRIGGTVPCRAGAIHTSTWTVSACAATGAERTKMLLFLGGNRNEDGFRGVLGAAEG